MASRRAPQDAISVWARDFAAEFHGFYRDCKVLSDDPELTQARLWLTEACRVGLANALAVLGVNAPDEMTRLDPQWRCFFDDGKQMVLIGDFLLGKGGDRKRADEAQNGCDNSEGS